MAIASIAIVPLRGNIKRRELTVGDSPHKRVMLKEILATARAKRLAPRSMRLYVNGRRMRQVKDGEFKPRHHIVEIVLVEKARRRKEKYG
ncbi:MAG: hypothetical protein Athens041674_749 [Parcubacteria group bacterium Athens0416_74]|nr:MAG: hypothetical protein Athens041674_749 [Parcubacteria group bacterium Athens0416_74]